MASSSFSTTADKINENQGAGFQRLTQNYEQRKAMEKALVETEKEMVHYHYPIGLKFFMFLKRIKFRIFFLCTIGAICYYWGNLLGMASDRWTRLIKKYKKRWIYKYNRSAVTLPSALEAMYVPENLSKQSTDKLSKLFVKIDKEMDYGFSRQIVADCLIKMNLMDAGKEEGKFLDKSGHQYARSKKLNSLSMKEYLTVLEEKFTSKDDPKKELECVDKFIQLVEQDKATFMERVMVAIKEEEMTPYEHKVRREQREAEAKRLEQEADPNFVATPEKPESRVPQFLQPVLSKVWPAWDGGSSKTGETPIDETPPVMFKVEKLNEVSGPHPTPGTKVKVHYTGRLADGTVFDSSVTRGQPFSFNVGCGEVIQGWDEGIVQLAKGQKAILTCPPEYAYGQRGSGMIPANATLTFEVELIDFERFDF